MAVVVYKTADITVDNISARNQITRKIDNMSVLVMDAIADPEAGQGKALYRYNAKDNSWVIVYSEYEKTISFFTDELLIANGKVIPTYPIQDSQAWNILVLEGDVEHAVLRLENLTVIPDQISGLDSFNGKKLRFTYAYGTAVQQIRSIIDTNNIVGEY